jgi:adenylylsulfate kinase
VSASAGTIWITGLSASGKSSLARALAGELRAASDEAPVLLDGDEFRARLDRAYGYSLEERFAVLYRLVEEAREENLKGRTVIVATISHKRAMRTHARRRIGRFMEVHLHCPVEVCATRDPNGLYRRARAGEYECFPGITEPYEHSEDPELVLDTAALSTESAVRRLLPETLAFVRAADDPRRPEPARPPEAARARVAALRERIALDGDDSVAEAGNANVTVRLRERCGQLFFIYAGISGMPGMNGLRFLQESGLADRNLLMIRDPYNDDFMRGVGEGIHDIEALLDWHLQWKRRLAHAREVYCIGNSMGGYAAVLFAYLLGAKTAWAFGLRPVGGAPMMQELQRLLDSDEGGTTYNLYYGTQDDDDRRFAEQLGDCAGVRLHPLEALPRYKRHRVMAALADNGDLREVFPPFRPATR